MEDNGQNNNFENRLDDVQQSNQIRQDSDVNVRNAGMRGARRYDGISNHFFNPFKGQDSNNHRKSPNDKKLVNNSDALSSKNNTYKNNTHHVFQNGYGGNSSSLSKNKQLTDNLGFKQRMAKEALRRSASFVSGLGAPANAKRGDGSLNETVQKPSLGKKKSLFPFFDSSNESIDDNGVSKEKEENSLDKVSIKILTPKMKILLPIVTACCVVVFGVCIVMVASQAYISILGIDLSSSITYDSKDVQDKLTRNESNLENDEIDREITDNNN